MKNNPIKERSFRFTLSIMKLYKELQAQSKKDFLHKMTIASKEARETSYWLRLLNEGGLTSNSISEYLDEIDQIIKIITKIVKTTSENLNGNN